MPGCHQLAMSMFCTFLLLEFALRKRSRIILFSIFLSRYVRVNKGNQLVRNPKKVIRMLASEKVRWSLHTVRTRLAKKQQYCQFFTRFGECKKSGGKCPYIHDRAKVAICTKFLKGLCSNTSCKLTHKVRYFFLILLLIMF